VCEFWTKQNQPLVDLVIINHSRFEKPTDQKRTDRAQAAAVAGLRAWALAQAARCTPENFLERYRGPSVIYKGWQRLFFGAHHPLCTPGRGMLAAGHDGTLYPCEAYIGTDRWRIGDVWNGIEADRLKAFLAECGKAEKICAACPTEPTCDKPCLGLSAGASPAENILEGCAMSRRVTDLVQESFDRLMQKKGRRRRNE
jgi:radical SAM protein with 4Fe4S-binding SPASM domain